MGRTISAKDAVRALEAAGFRIDRQRGSHITLKHPDGRLTQVPMHSGDLKSGTMRSIERAVGFKLKD
ncbi:MAG: type II toxin-antitoxin system HicA family toxin [Rhodospirillaceae bacterium]|nr:type II toxin-antitoxin system HicA family toxin [Rhodospirillaceae bacterium]